MVKVDSLKDWTKTELFYKVDGPHVSLLLKITKPGGDEFVYPCKLADAGTVCGDGVVRFNSSKLKLLLEIALPRMLVSLFESLVPLEKQEGFTDET